MTDPKNNLAKITIDDSKYILIDESKPLNFTEIDPGASKYIKQLTNKPISNLPTLNKRNAIVDDISKEQIYTVGTDKIILKEINSISTNTVKTLKRIIADFTKKNSIQNLISKNVDYRVTLDIEKMALERGVLSKEHLENNKKRNNVLKEFRKKIKKDIEVLRDSVVLDNNENYINTSILATGAIQNRGKTLYITLNPDFADDLLKTNTIIKYPKVLDLVDARDKNTYALGNALGEHFSKYTNQKSNKKYNKKPTYDRLKVKTCLSKLPESMTYDEILKKGASWTREHKDKLENSLDNLQKIGFLANWRYGFANGKLLEDDQIVEHTTNYSKWINLNVYFTPNQYWDLIKDEKTIKAKEKELKKINKIYETTID